MCGWVGGGLCDYRVTSLAWQLLIQLCRMSPCQSRLGECKNLESRLSELEKLVEYKRERNCRSVSISSDDEQIIENGENMSSYNSWIETLKSLQIVKRTVRSCLHY